MTTPPLHRGGSLFVAMLAASLASTIGGLPFNSLPVMLGSLADSFGLPAASVGLLGSVCFAGYLVGTLGAPLWMNRMDWRLLTVVGALGTAISFVLSALVVRLPVLYAAWASIGFFASTMTCLGMRVLSDLPDKVRAFGVRQGTELSVTAAVLFVLPPLVIAQFRYPGAACALAAVVVVLGLSACWVPRHSLLAPQQAAGPQARLGAASWFALGVFFLFLVGNIGLWAFLERIGASLHIAPASMGLVFAVLKLLGGLAAFSTAIAGERFGRQLPYFVVTALIAAGLALLAYGAGFLPVFVAFALGAWVWEFAFTCGCVLQTAEIARTDSAGRAVVLVPAAFALASMVGPGLAGRLLATGNFTVVLTLALISSLVPVAVVIVRSVMLRGTRLSGSQGF
jgi:predicted MFS family arabinose efflux permease